MNFYKFILAFIAIALSKSNNAAVLVAGVSQLGIPVVTQTLLVRPVVRALVPVAVQAPLVAGTMIGAAPVVVGPVVVANSRLLGGPVVRANGFLSRFKKSSNSTEI